MNNAMRSFPICSHLASSGVIRTGATSPPEFNENRRQHSSCVKHFTVTTNPYGIVTASASADLRGRAGAPGAMLEQRPNITYADPTVIKKEYERFA